MLKGSSLVALAVNTGPASPVMLPTAAGHGAVVARPLPSGKGFFAKTFRNGFDDVLH